VEENLEKLKEDLAKLKLAEEKQNQ